MKVIASIYCAYHCSKVFTFIYSFKLLNGSVCQELSEVQFTDEKAKFEESQKTRPKSKESVSEPQESDSRVSTVDQ